MVRQGKGEAVIWILKFWQPIVSAILTAIVAFGLHSVVSNISEANHKAELLKQATQMTEQCNEDKLKIQKAGENYEARITILNHKLRTLSSVRPSCVPITGSPGVDHATSGNSQLLSGNGISSNWLIQFAGRCEREAIKLDSLQEFINPSSQY